MAQVRAESERIIAARPEEVYAALIDYQHKRPSILTPNFLDYTVESGGVGEGTVIGYRLQAAGRERPYFAQAGQREIGYLFANATFWAYKTSSTMGASSSQGI